jgi:hypothetical protein
MYHKGVEFEEVPHSGVAQQGTSTDGSAPSPFLRLGLLLLAVAQHWRRAADLPPDSVPNQPPASPQVAAALRAALKQQLTPTCCAQVLQRLAPSYWAVATRFPLRTDGRIMATEEMNDACYGTVARSLAVVGDMCCALTAPCAALGEC